MTTLTRVALPILYVSVKMNLVKGRRWSIIEHAILTILCGKGYSVEELAVKSDLPDRLVIESLIRLMRVGWVEMTEKHTGITFRSSASGHKQAKSDELQRITTPIRRVGLFVVDKFTGACFRARDLKIYPSRAVDELVKNNSIVVITEPSLDGELYCQFEAISMLLDEDEEYVGCDDIGARESNRYALFTVRGNEVEGLPASAPSKIRDIILETAKLGHSSSNISSSIANEGIKSRFEETVEIKFDPKNDFIVGGDAHREAIIKALREANEWIVIHSTFLNVDAFRSLAPELIAAADRGVRIDLLWGQSENSPSRGQTVGAIRECEKMLQSPTGGASIQFQPFSTGSHVKVLLYDTRDCPMIAVVGSCNWLSSHFNSLEASVRLRDSKIVRLVAAIVAELARPLRGHWSALSRDLAGHAANLGNQQSIKGTNITARLVLGSSHNETVLRARDTAKQSIVWGSNRLNSNARTLAIAPMLAAVKQNKVLVDLFFGQLESDLESTDKLFNSNHETLSRDAISFHHIDQPRMHAKFLYWDDDNILVTSQNLLSADAEGHSYLFSELGIYLSGGEVAKHFEAFYRDQLD